MRQKKKEEEVEKRRRRKREREREREKAGERKSAAETGGMEIRTMFFFFFAER